MKSSRWTPLAAGAVAALASSVALAAPVVLGITFCAAVRPPFQSFLLGPSTVFCVAV